MAGNQVVCQQQMLIGNLFNSRGSIREWEWAIAVHLLVTKSRIYEGTFSNHETLYGEGMKYFLVYEAQQVNGNGQ